MNKQYERSIAALGSLINEGAIDRAIRQYSEAESQHNRRSSWYLLSYPTFLATFRRTSGSQDVDAWIQRVACVFSWIARIPTPSFEDTVLQMLADIERLYAGSTLWEIGTESYLGGVAVPGRESHHGERIFGTTAQRGPALLRDFLEPANALLNGSDRWQNTIPTSSKLLHFMCPRLFPILDGHVSKIMNLGTPPTYVDYHAYTFALQDFLAANRLLTN